MTHSEAQSKIMATNGHFFGVTFKKKDGTIRTMNARLGVKRYLKGGKSTVDQSKYATVYDVVAKGYRNIDLDTVIEVKCGSI